MELLKKLTETPGVSGREERIREVIEKEVAGLFDEVRTDPMGSLICTRNPRPAKDPAKGQPADKPTTVMLACHMDEIGFYVSHVDEKTGFLRVHNIGGFDTRTLLARRVLVQGTGGDLMGIMSAAKPIHVMSEEEKKRIPEIGDVYIDLMLDAKVVAKKVRIGDPVTMWQPMLEIGNCYVGKAMDNRVASWVAINAVRKLAKHNCRIVYVATSQEEVGLRGAQTASFAVQPDIGIALDVTIAADTPGVGDSQRVTALAGGVALKVVDSGSIPDRGLLDTWVRLAEKRKIKNQP
ncbi:MAG: M42 family peptidase, partial [Phycisphaerae bacterium]|nr:M42 family peptidase [Phycisphaerae bacterium]